MVIHLIFVFTLILAIALFAFHIIFWAYYSKQKTITATQEYRQTGLIITFFIIIYGVISPIIIFTVTLYILLLVNPNLSPLFAYLYWGFGVGNYVLIFGYLIYQTLVLNSLWIKVDNNFLYLLDETIPLLTILGIKPGFINKLLYQIDGEVAKKTIIGKKTFIFLKNVSITPPDNRSTSD